MRKISLLTMLVAIAISVTFYSCKKDDDSTSEQEGNEQLADEQNATEETKIPTTTLDSQIDVAYATKETGAPPSPNSNIDFQLNTDLQEAFQGTGFKIQFSSSASIAGAYIQFKDADGTPANSYFDVTDFNDANKTAKNKSSKIFKNQNTKTKKAAEDFDNEIQVDFGDNIPAGQFCYDICLYDTSNNISQILTVCVTVEAWGGNASIVGEWILDSQEPEDNNEITINCQDDSSFDALDYQYTKNEWTFVLNEDGSYYEIYDNEGSEIDEEASSSACSAIYSDETYENLDKYSGNWAYNEDNETLTLVDFKYEDLLDEENTEEYEGQIYFEGVEVEIISGQLVLTAEYEGETYKVVFNRK